MLNKEYIKKIYNENDIIKQYVDKYANNRGLTVDEALQHKIVLYYISNTLKLNEDEDWRTLLWQKQTKKQ